MTPIRLAVIGAGHLGRIHARLLAQREDVRLVGIVDPIAAAREEVAAANGTKPYASHWPLLGEIDAAVIATPTRLHHAVAAELLCSGVHVLVEKPITTTLPEADQLIALAAEHRCVLQVGHVERFNPAWRQVESLVGEPRYIEATRCGPYTFRSIDVSVVHDLMIHDLDLVLSLVRSPVQSVTAVGASVLGKHYDLANARVEFANGAVATFNASRLNFEPQRQIRLFAAEGFTSVDFVTRTATHVALSPAVARGEFDAEQLSPAERGELKDHVFSRLLPRTDFPPADGNAMADEQGDFLTAIRTGRAPHVDGRQGRAALDVCEQICSAISARLAADAIAPSRRAA